MATRGWVPWEDSKENHCDTETAYVEKQHGCMVVHAAVCAPRCATALRMSTWQTCSGCWTVSSGKCTAAVDAWPRMTPHLCGAVVSGEKRVFISKGIHVIISQFNLSGKPYFVNSALVPELFIADGRSTKPQAGSRGCDNFEA